MSIRRPCRNDVNIVTLQHAYRTIAKAPDFRVEASHALDSLCSAPYMQLPNYQPGDCHVREWFKTEMGRENEKTAILAALIDHLSSVLQDSSSFAGLKKQEYPYPREGHLQSLLQTWEDVKIDIADTLDSEDTERIKAR